MELFRKISKSRNARNLSSSLYVSLYLRKFFFLFLERLKEAFKLFRRIYCTTLPHDLREKENFEHKAEMQEIFHLHFTLLYTSVSFCLFLWNLKEAMTLIRTFSSTTIWCDFKQKVTIKQKCKKSFISTLRLFRVTRESQFLARRYRRQERVRKHKAEMQELFMCN